MIIEFIMTVDLTQAKPGDFLISKHGMVFIYEKYLESLAYPHMVRYPKYVHEGTVMNVGASGSRTNDGQVFDNNNLPEDHDIVMIIPREQFLSQVNSLNVWWSQNKDG